VSHVLEKKFATFLKKSRGEMTFAQFSKKTGLRPREIFSVNFSSW